MRLSTRLVLVALAFSFIQPSFSQQAKKRVETSDQLPVHSYPLSGKASDLLNNDAAFAKLALALQRDLLSDLRQYHIEDKATLKNYYRSLMQISYLNGQYDEALSYLQERTVLEDKPVARTMAGYIEHPLIDAAKAGPERAQKIFESEFAERVQRLPYDTVQNEVKLEIARFEGLSANYWTSTVAEQYDTAAQKTGTISKDAAMDIVNTRFRIGVVLSHTDFIVQQLRALVAAHRLEKKDIWADRTVTLSEDEHLTPTVIAIWDTGVDPSVFPGKMWINTREIPLNGKDDDGNGYIDDVNGIGWDWYGKKSVGPLLEMHVTQAEIDTNERYTKGLGDMEANLDTPESAEVRKKLSTLSAEQMRSFTESLSLYGLYSHGTSVAGIALAGNPAGRVLIIRQDWPERKVPPPPNQQWAEGWVGALRDSVRYLRDNGARTVNMSWGISAQEIEDDLEASGSGGTVEQRHAAAERYFQMLHDSFLDAIKGAPNVLFIAAPDNGNSDSRFNQEIPAAFHLPNTMVLS